jgi:hypothetical protein
MDHGPRPMMLRGNFASGNSTVASQLQRALGAGPANIGTRGVPGRDAQALAPSQLQTAARGQLPFVVMRSG